jgi:hypothetical protein
VRYRDAMRLDRDSPDGYAEFSRLAGEVGLQAPSVAQQAARYAQWGLVDEARETYAGLAASLGSDLTYVELSRRRAQLAAEAGDLTEIQTLEADAGAALRVEKPVGGVFGRLVELTGYDVVPARVRPGEPIDLTYHWRLLASPPTPLSVYVHFRGDQGQRTRFGDDHPLPAPIPGLGAGPQHVSERRRILVPAEAEPGRYRLVAGVWSPASEARLRRWWRGIVPTLDTTIEIGTIEVLPPS